MNDCDQGCLKNPKNVGTYVCAYFLNQYDFCKTGLTNTLQYSLRQRLILISSQANGISKWLFQWHDTTKDIQRLKGAKVTLSYQLFGEVRTVLTTLIQDSKS